jgi:hypothetical protein
VQGEIGIVTHQLAEQAVGRLVQARPLPAGMRLWGNGPHRTLLAQHFLNEGETNPEQVR